MMRQKGSVSTNLCQTVMTSFHRKKSPQNFRESIIYWTDITENESGSQVAGFVFPSTWGTMVILLCSGYMYTSSSILHVIPVVFTSQGLLLRQGMCCFGTKLQLGKMPGSRAHQSIEQNPAVGICHRGWRTENMATALYCINAGAYDLYYVCASFQERWKLCISVLPSWTGE